MSVDIPDYVTLSAMITPALFITGNGSLIISTSNRMSRVVDRIRVLNDQADALGRGATNLDFLEERRAHIDDQLCWLEWRGDRIRIALVLLYTAFGSSWAPACCSAWMCCSPTRSWPCRRRWPSSAWR